jgi:hypothetical protein
MIKNNFNKMDFDLMLDAFEEATANVPRREMVKKLLQIQVERDAAITFGLAFCETTGNVSGLINDFRAFTRAIGEA